MPNTIPAAGEAMPKTTRRAFLAGVAVAAIPASVAATATQTQSSGLTALVEKHKQAVAADRAAWEAMSDFDDMPELQARPMVRVQVGRTLMGKNDAGEDVWKLNYVASEGAIRDVFEKHDQWAPGRMFHGSQQWVADRRAAHYRLMEEKLEELRAIRAEITRIEDGCGYTAALTEARRLSAIVKGIEAEIIAYVPVTFQEAIDKANWCVWASKDDYCYLYDSYELSDVLTDVLASIGRAAA